MVREHTDSLELIFPKVADVDVVLARDVAALALARALEGLARIRRAVGPLEAAGAVDLISIPLATISSAIFAGQLAVALAVALEPLARVFGAIGVAIFPNTVALAVHDLALEDLSARFGAVLVVVSGGRVRNFEVPMNPQHVEVVIDGHAFKS